MQLYTGKILILFHKINYNISTWTIEYKILAGPQVNMDHYHRSTSCSETIHPVTVYYTVQALCMTQLHFTKFNVHESIFLVTTVSAYLASPISFPLYLIKVIFVRVIFFNFIVYSHVWTSEAISHITIIKVRTTGALPYVLWQSSHSHVEPQENLWIFFTSPGVLHEAVCSRRSLYCNWGRSPPHI